MPEKQSNYQGKLHGTISREERGTSAWRMTGPILGTAWIDSVSVRMSSTIHAPTYPPGTNEEDTTVHRRVGRHGGVNVPCPPSVKEYNKTIGGVDFADQCRKYYSYGRKTKRWYRRIFFYLLEVVINNSYITVKRQRRGRLEFRKELAEQLIADTRARKSTKRPREEERL